MAAHDVFTTIHADLADRYAIERELGRGGMASVFLARDLKHSRRVAIKVLHPELAASLGAERFLREIEIAAGLTHPNILPLHDSGSASGLLYYVMPFVEGESLRDRLVRDTQLPLGVALQLARETADALAYAHAHGVIHRDIKPENILLASGHALVADFGIARALHAAGSARLTGTGMGLGTPAYMSPEQAAGDPADARSDTYALGCVLYEMLAGKPPFAGGTSQELITRRFVEPPPHAAATRADVPVALDAAIVTAMATAPEHRFATIEEFARALDAVHVPGARSDGAARGALGGGRRTVLLAAATLAAAAAIWAILGRTSVADAAPARLAVLPFSVHGSDSFSYLRGGMVDLLTRNLDGLGPYRTIDVATVLTNAQGGGNVKQSAAPDSRALARRLNAGVYVVGSVHVNGPRMRMQAELFQSGADSASVARASAEGDTTAVFALVDSLTVGLVASQSRSPGARLSATAAKSSHSLSALKSYLEGEQQLRSALYDSAAHYFRQAVTDDTSFALAYYRLAVSNGLLASRMGARWEPAVAASARALRFANRLGARDSLLLEGYDAYVHGRADDAERRYRAILDDYPDELEAKFLLAETLMRYNPPRGRSIGEAKALYTDMARLDQRFFCYI
ncbi:MAG TPA: serine/threonine-protein kinase [Gemmatimonadaceae bacterium]|nr:serine/threonine-protein kinase [Gemmatimonadaceae bacterium]